MTRKATPNDVSRIAEIHVCGWRYAYRGIATDRELFTDRQVVKSVRSVQKGLEDGDNILVFDDETDGVLKGFAWHSASRDTDRAEAHEICALYVQPEFTRSGVGTALVKAVAAEARALGRRELLIWVVERNLRGVAFYLKAGFKADGARKPVEGWATDEVRMAMALELGSQNSVNS